MNRLAFDPAFVQRVAGALLHFVWEGAAIAVITAICLRLMSRRSAEARYLLSIAGFAGMLAAPVLTFVLYDRIGHVTLKAMVWASEGNTSTAVAASPSLMYWIVGLWSAGVFGSMGRLLLAWHFSRQWVRLATHEVPTAVAAIFERTAVVVGLDVLRNKVRLRVSGAVDSPVVIGWIRPAILVPVSALTGLTDEQLMAVLAHELAHIRRHDFLVNTLQTCVESLLFYHPAVWWLSGRVRAERENCCDDFAVRACGDRRLYVQALVDLERARPRAEALAVSATGGSLKDRAQRLLGFETSSVDWRSILVTFAFVCVWMIAGIRQSAFTGATPPEPQPLQPAQLAAALPALPTLTPAAATTVVSTVAAIATAQPVVPEAQVPEQSGVVTGILLSNSGLPLEGVRVTVTRVDRPIADVQVEYWGRTNGTGRYRLEKILPGRYYIRIGYDIRPIQINAEHGITTDFRIYHPGVAELARATTIEVAGSTIEVPAMLFGGNVTGRVVDMATGKGRRIKSLVLCCDYSKPNTRPRAFTFAPTISDDGSFIFPLVPPGNYSLSTEDPNVMPVSWALAVGTNGVTGLQLDVLDGVEVQGTVVDQTGRPTSASVQLRPKPADAVFTTIGPPLNTAYAGVTLGAARFVLPAEPGWGPQIPSLERIRDRIVEVARSQVRSATAAPDGRFEFHRVYPGNYVLEVNSGGITVPVQEIQVGLGALTNVSLNTSLSLQVPGIQVTGRVVGPSGAPLPKLNYIRLVRSADSNVFYGFPDAEGRFSLVLVPGAYRVFAERLGRPVQSVSDGSRDITNAEFTVEGGRNLQIVVTLEP